MKNKINRLTLIKEIELFPPVIKDNKITYSFSKNSLLDEKGFFIEPKNIKLPNEIYEELLLPYLPICIAFAVIKDIKIILPYKVSDYQINLWNEIIKNTANIVFKNKSGITLINGTSPIKPRNTKGQKSGLFFGGGSESLLVLSKLTEKNIKPILLSFEGHNWSGCDYNNPHKFMLEEELLKEFNLHNIKINTSFFELIYTPDNDWREYLDHEIWGIIRSALHAPFMVTSIISIAEELDIAELFFGLEEENGFFPEDYCFSTKAVNLLKKLSNKVLLKRELENYIKIDVIRDLHLNYPKAAKYHYSCAKNNFERWCLSCEECFKIWLGLKVYNIDVSTVGIDQNVLKKRIPKMLFAARKEIASRKELLKEYETYFKEAKRLNNSEVLHYQNKLCKNLWLFKIRKPFSIIKKKIKFIYSFIRSKF